MDTINSIGNAKQILREVSRVIVGKDEVMIKVLLGIVAGGHILMEDIPGVGKTTMALAFSKALGLEYNRVQFTPDVLPSDVTGYSIYDKNTGTMRYQRGAVLCNLFLADELNRATSRTQSALLQAMEEGAVTVWTTTPTPCRSRSSSLQRRTRPAPRARRCCRIRRWTDSCCASLSATPVPRTRPR